MENAWDGSAEVLGSSRTPCPCCRPRALTRRPRCGTAVRRVRAPGLQSWPAIPTERFPLHEAESPAETQRRRGWRCFRLMSPRLSGPAGDSPPAYLQGCRPRALTRRQGCRTWVRRVRAPGLQAGCARANLTRKARSRLPAKLPVCLAGTDMGQHWHPLQWPFLAQSIRRGPSVGKEGISARSRRPPCRRRPACPWTTASRAREGPGRPDPATCGCSGRGSFQRRGPCRTGSPTH